MDPLTALAIARFVIGAINEGIPVAEKAIALLHATDDAQAKALLPELEAAYAKAKDRAASAHQKVQGA